jgi:hypothetical protein
VCEGTLKIRKGKNEKVINGVRGLRVDGWLREAGRSDLSA